MSQQTPVDKVIALALDRITDTIRLYHDTTKCESPIERILVAAIYSEATYGRGLTHSFENCAIDDLLSYGNAETTPDVATSNWFHMKCQAKVLDSYRADFLVMSYCHKAMAWKYLVVECDGHNFHERTKDQAARDRSRDRAMQEAGYTVFRFTGAEIYRDPNKCAQQVVAWANKVVFG